MKTPSNLTTLLIATASALTVTPLSAIKIVVPDQYKDQVEAIKAAELSEREQELQGANESADSGLTVDLSKGKAEDDHSPEVATDEFLVQSVIEATDAATEFELNLAAGEGIISGQIIDKESGQPLSGVAILLEDTNIATVTDSEGRYSIGPAPAGEYTVSFVKTGYIEANVTDYAIVGGEVSVFPFGLPPRPADMSDEVYELQDFTVTAEEANSMMMKLELVMESDSVLNLMSSEDFSKFAASDIGDAVKRVAGVSVVGGKYAVIRGLGDRYVQTTLNGMPIASPDPDRQAVQLDLFPSGLFEGLEVTKSYMVDRSANSTGAINLKIKDFPEELTIQVGGGLAYHSIATGNDDFLTNGATTSDDVWANGAKNRQLTEAVRNGVPELTSAQFVNDFLADLVGVPFITQAESDAQLQASAEFTEKQLGTYNYVQRKSQDPDHNFKISAGDTIELDNKLSLGLLGSLNYSSKNRMVEDAYYFRASNSPNLGSPSVLSAENFGDPTKSITYQDLNYDESIESYGVSWFAGAGLNFGDDHSVRLQRMQLRKNENLNALYVGEYYHPKSERDQKLESLATQDMRYTERELISDQILGEHIFDLSLSLFKSLQFNWGVGADQASQDEIYFVSSLRGSEESGYSIFLDPFPETSAVPVIYKGWREIIDERDYKKYDIKLESVDSGGFASTLKLGYLSTNAERGLTDEFVTYEDTDGNFDELSDLDSLLASSYTLGADIDLLSESEGYYIMGEQKLFDRLRVIGGGRFQADTADVQVNGELRLRGAGTENSLANLPTEGGYDVEAWYPAATLIYDFSDSLNARIAYSKTLALPSPREVSPFATNTFGANDIEIGNPLLQPSDVENFDIGSNFVSDAGDSVGVTLFHKKVAGRIERLNGLNIDTDAAMITTNETLGAALYSWYNNPSESTITGIELEGRKELAFLDLGGPFDCMSVGGNYAYIDGQVDRFPIEVERKENVGISVDESRALTEQPEHILNLDLTYDNPERGLRVSLIYYYISDTLKAVSLDTGYDIYSEGYSALDMTLSQEFWDRYKLSIALKNLTNPKRGNYYDVEGRKFEADSERKGRVFSISLSGEF